MNISELGDYLKAHQSPALEFYSDKLRLRPNYLIYCLEKTLTSHQKDFLTLKEIPWATLNRASPMQALTYFLKKVGGGVYAPDFDKSLCKEHQSVSIFLLDPHLIDEFEETISQLRLGVLIKRNILAARNFSEVVSLEDIWSGPF